MDPLPTPSPCATNSPAMVLDTNVLLDWLVFDDPHAAPWVTALKAGRVQWLATLAMREEMQRVLGYESIAPRLANRHAVDEAWARHASLIETPTQAPMICTDPDDQKFIDLAVAHRAKWLLTKDAALLQLARRALPWGIRILQPANWSELELHASNCHLAQ